MFHESVFGSIFGWGFARFLRPGCDPDGGGLRSCPQHPPPGVQQQGLPAPVPPTLVGLRLCWDQLILGGSPNGGYLACCPANGFPPIAHRLPAAVTRVPIRFVSSCEDQGDPNPTSRLQPLGRDLGSKVHLCLWSTPPLHPNGWGRSGAGQTGGHSRVEGSGLKG